MIWGLDTPMGRPSPGYLELGVFRLRVAHSTGGLTSPHRMFRFGPHTCKGGNLGASP